KAKSRELNKRLKSSRNNADTVTEIEVREQIVYRQHWLPWLLLLSTWLAVGGYFIFI
ncbi:MAG: DUF2956 family protein, partial [Gammaproteobacteria bacterium]|nr:DUF2956 family protein [Gammaproteobacteria bacterium]